MIVSVGGSCLGGRYSPEALEMRHLKCSPETLGMYTRNSILRVEVKGFLGSFLSLTVTHAVGYDGHAPWQCLNEATVKHLCCCRRSSPDGSFQL